LNTFKYKVEEMFELLDKTFLIKKMIKHHEENFIIVNQIFDDHAVEIVTCGVLTLEPSFKNHV